MLFDAALDIKVLRLHGGQEARYGLERSAPQAGNHIHHKGKVDNGQEQADDTDVLQVLVAFELEFAKQVDTHEAENDNPQSQVGLAIKQTPVAVEVSHGEELETECQLQEGKHHLDGVQPATRLHVLQHGGEHGQQGEGGGKADAKAQHGDEAHPAVCGAGGKAHQCGTEDRTGAAERHQHGGEGDKERSQQTSLVSLFVRFVNPLLGHLNLKQTEETERKDEEDDEEKQVGNPVGADKVQCFGAEDKGEDGTQHGK